GKHKREALLSQAHNSKRGPLCPPAADQQPERPAHAASRSSEHHGPCPAANGVDTEEIRGDAGADCRDPRGEIGLLGGLCTSERLLARVTDAIGVRADREAMWALHRGLLHLTVVR